MIVICLLALLKCFLKIECFLGFLGYLGHPSLIAWSSSLRLFVSIQESYCFQDIVLKLLLVRDCEVIFISIYPFFMI